MKDYNLQILSLVSGYNSAIRKEKLLVMLQAYIDDSISNDNKEMMFLAGFVNNADNWMKFSDQWSEELNKYPSIEYFKMSEAQNRQGQFYGWDEKERDKKVINFRDIIIKNSGFSIQCSVSRKEYNEIVRPFAPHGLGNAYFACFYGLIFCTAKTQKQLGIENIPIDFVFDDQGGLGDEAAFFYRYLKQQHEPELECVLGSTPIFRDDKKVLPLQAADMMAWQVRREIQSPDSTGTINSKDLLSECCRMEVHIDSAMLQRMADGFKEIEGSKALSDKPIWRKTKKLISELEQKGINPFFRN